MLGPPRRASPPTHGIPLSRAVQASAAYPENTLASFEAAIRDGAEGIESGRCCLGALAPPLISRSQTSTSRATTRSSCSTTPISVRLHLVLARGTDNRPDRTTNGTGRVQTQDYHGGLDQLLTNKLPAQKIPTFRETLDLLMRPENLHVYLNIDVKVDNEPVQLFTLMHAIISTHPDYETKLGPRLVLGLWHPKYVTPACELLPYIRLAHIGMSPSMARKYFWDACDSFSMNFSCLVGNDGEQFRKECKTANKDLYVWTVNKRSEMIEATKWGAKAILTDRTAEFLALRAQMESTSLLSVVQLVLTAPRRVVHRRSRDDVEVCLHLDLVLFACECASPRHVRPS